MQLCKHGVDTASDCLGCNPRKCHFCGSSTGSSIARGYGPEVWYCPAHFRAAEDLLYGTKVSL